MMSSDFINLLARGLIPDSTPSYKNLSIFLISYLVLGISSPMEGKKNGIDYRFEND